VVATAVLIETASRSLARAPFYSDGTLASRGRRPGSARRNTPTQRSRPPPLYPAKTRETVHRTEMETPPELPQANDDGQCACRCGAPSVLSKE